MIPLSREEKLKALFPGAPMFRLKQMEEALFSSLIQGFADISNMPLSMREVMTRELDWFSIKEVQVFESKKKDTFKAVVETVDGKRVETVLMQNARNQWTVCVSSQVGCAMACTFCATGTMGFTRNLLADEIVDQVRFWNVFLEGRKDLERRISNVVFMGMGEPLANYDNVREALRLLLAYTDIGMTRITVSTVGLLPMLKKLLDDPAWPAVRLAVSVHSADSDTRKSIMPSSYDGFLDALVQWTEDYFEKFESRRRHLTFEYVMLGGINDTEKHAKALIRFAERVGKVRINLIPYNFTGSVYKDSLPGDFIRFQKQLEDAGVVVTRRRTMGDDIAAACGQLVVEKNVLAS
ncbi:MAG: 23S rRNA (adenine(2503)-C(2))-methyltransferase RlmN [Candidatus Moranbacteria bacterium]|nr:23S rRNA (adenine(2503)-C(2))-methyltransferase RlmN [Candidatus Moranbacteria bacterium]